MLVLPLVYFGLIVLAGSAVWWHLTANTWILAARSGGVWKVVAYLGPAVAGTIVVFFMIKPILARPAKRVDPLPLWPDDEPELHRFIEQICRQVRAPIPSRIQVDCQINASASFTSLLLALVRPQFVLTIGLPLGGGLTVRQFGGVLAHEFGHFAQGGGMRLTFLVRSINGWFARVVGERDQWDEALERWSDSGHAYIVIIFKLASASVWCSRRILTGLMIAGHAISCFMMRQMEYDADSYEIKLVGSNAFVATSARIRELNVGAQLGYRDLHDGWMRRTLPSNLPAFLLERTGRIPTVLASQLREAPDSPTGYFDTHPSEADRARAAEHAACAGIMTGGDVPASLLFANFDALGAAATRHHYEHDLGVSLDGLTLVGTETTVQSSVDREQRQQAIELMLGDCVSPVRPLAVPTEWLSGRTAGELVEGLRTARTTMNMSAEPAAAAYARFLALQRTLELARCACALFEAGYTKVVPTDFELAEGTPESAKQSEAGAIHEQQKLVPDLTRFETAVGQRLGCAIGLLAASDHALSVPHLERGQQVALQREVARLVPALNALARTWPNVVGLRFQATVFGLLSGNAQRSPDPGKTNARLAQGVDAMQSLLRRMRDDLTNTPAPETNEEAAATLASLLRLDETTDREAKTAWVLDATFPLYFGVLGRLVEICSIVEGALDAAAAG